MTEQPIYPPPSAAPQAWPSPPPARSGSRLTAGLIGGAIGGIAGLAIGGIATFVFLGMASGGGAYASLGEDPRIDGLYTSCGEGNMAACDLLYYESAIDSELERYAGTCGDRVSNPGNDYCTELDPQGDAGSLDLSA